MNSPKRTIKENGISPDKNSIIVIVEQGCVTKVQTAKPMDVTVIDFDVITDDDDSIIQEFKSEVFDV